MSHIHDPSPAVSGGASEPGLFSALIVRARDGDRDAIGALLESHRPFLKQVAAKLLDSDLGPKLDDSDLVQHTSLDALRGFGRFAGSSPEEFQAWLQTILRRNAIDAVCRYKLAEMRDVRRESTEIAPAEFITSKGASPEDDAIRFESIARLRAAMAHLTDEQGQAVRLRFIRGWTLAEIAQEMGRTEEAAAKLIYRGLASLRKRLVASE